MRCTPPAGYACKPVKPGDDHGLTTLVRSYQQHNRRGSVEEVGFFRGMQSLDVAIHHAGLATNAHEKRFSHQYRIPFAVLRRAKSLLAAEAASLKAHRSFHELHTSLTKLFAPVRGIGELYVYDTALRLGAFLNLEPKHVYLHAGTRAGARSLGLSVRAGYIEVQDLPRAIQVLLPNEIEDFLCIYKSRLARQ